LRRLAINAYQPERATLKTKSRSSASDEMTPEHSCAPFIRTIPSWRYSRRYHDFALRQEAQQAEIAALRVVVSQRAGIDNAAQSSESIRAAASAIKSSGVSMSAAALESGTRKTRLGLDRSNDCAPWSPRNRVNAAKLVYGKTVGAPTVPAY